MNSRAHLSVTRAKNCSRRTIRKSLVARPVMAATAARPDLGFIVIVSPVVPCASAGTPVAGQTLANRRGLLSDGMTTRLVQWIAARMTGPGLVERDYRLPLRKEVIGLVLDGAARAFPMGLLSSLGRIEAAGLHSIGAGQVLVLLGLHPGRAGADHGAGQPEQVEAERPHGLEDGAGQPQDLQTGKDQ